MDIKEPSLRALFGTPLIHARLDSARREELLSYIAQLKDEAGAKLDYRIGFSNTGWHSPQWTGEQHPTPFAWVLDAFKRHLLDGIQQVVHQEIGGKTITVTSLEADVVLWSVINASHDYNLRHIHTSAWRDTWSLVYYLHVPDDIDGGEIRFFNPNLAYRCSQGTTLSRMGAELMYKKFSPRTGDLLLFPGWLEHDVLPFTTSGERVVVAANFGIKGIGYT